MAALMKKVTSGLGALVRGHKSRRNREDEKQHTYCFMCARTFFSRVLERCTHCNSDSVQHYTSYELELLAHRAM